MAKNLIVKSKKQHIRLWFELYKLCLTDPSLAENLRSSKEHYKPWGDVRSLKFDDWWNEHKQLFGVSSVEEIPRSKDLINHPNVLNLTVPLNQPITNVVRDVRALIEEKQIARLSKLGMDHRRVKSNRMGLGSYELTPGVEIRGKVIHEILVLYQYWVELGRPAINWNFIKKVHQILSSRPNSKWIPVFMIDLDPMDKSNVIRQMRRRISRGKKLCESVSRGQFPGRTTLS